MSADAQADHTARLAGESAVAQAALTQGISMTEDAAVSSYLHHVADTLKAGG